MTEIDLCQAKVGGKALVFSLFLPTTAGLLSLTSGGIKNKRTELDDRDWLRAKQKLGESISVLPGETHPSRFVITDFRW